MKNQIRFTERMRYREPKVQRDPKNGAVVALMCPFCTTPHPLSADQESMCGTRIEVRAFQPVYHGKSVTCARCGQSGGTFTKMGNNAYVHATQCVPGKDFYVETPKVSKSAEFAWRLPDSFLVLWGKLTKRTPERLVELDASGKPTDKVVGFRWKEMSNGSKSN